mmetsp:Transcript_33208/g.98908  ORF Transcript_33208/g.98908 Transcript_33208/m.98908 type:complete len:309 (+) Transcript_33208:645-1571(+)
MRLIRVQQRVRVVNARDVLDSMQYQPLRRSNLVTSMMAAGSCLDSVADLQLPADPLWRKLALADRNERARHVANHLVQETAATELKSQQPVWKLHDIHMVHCFDGVALPLAVRAIAQLREVVLSPQQRGALTHTRNVERQTVMHPESVHEHIMLHVCVDVIVVCLVGGTDGDIEVGRGAHELEHAYVTGKQPVDAIQGVGFAKVLVVRVKLHHLGMCVHAAVGAASSSNLQLLAVLAQARPKRMLDCALNAREARLLYLPSPVGSAVILNNHAVRIVADRPRVAVTGCRHQLLAVPGVRSTPSAACAR